VEAGESSRAEVPVSRVTVIGASGFEDDRAASTWLERCRRDQSERDELIETSLLVVNRAIHGHRIAGLDPYVRDVSAAQAHSVRIGYGTGDELVEGHRKDAYDLPPALPRRSSRRQLLAPQEELAGILSGRRPIYVSEDLVLRARLDLDQGRLEQAALQLRAGVDALAAELRGEAGAPHGGAAAFDGPAAAARKLATAALEGKLGEERIAELREATVEVERVLRRRRYGRSS
jgi:hypothetical protein